MDNLLLLLVSIPSLFFLFGFTTKGLFVNNFNPYEHLKDIDDFHSLRLPDGKGFKRYLCAIKYEGLKQQVLILGEFKYLIGGAVAYFLFVGLAYTLYLLSIPYFKDIPALIPYVKILPYIVGLYLAKLGLTAKTLEDKIGG